MSRLLSFLRNNQALLFRFVISASLIGFLLFFVEPVQILRSIRNVDSFSYLLAAVVFLLAQVINAGKWHLLLPEVKFLVLVKFTFIGIFYTLVLPGQLSGEIAKTWRLARGTKIAEQVAASVFIDRVTGVIALLILALSGAVLSSSQTASVVILPFALTFIMMFLSIFLMRVLWFRVFIESLVRWLMEPFPILEKQLPKVLKLIAHLTHYSNSSQKLLVSIFIGFVFQVAVVAITVIFAEDLGLHISFLDMAWIMGVISLLMILPISILGIGIRELSFIGLLGLFGIDAPSAVTLSLLFFSLQIVGAALGAAFELMAQKRA